jgi:hypothetical protein
MFRALSFVLVAISGKVAQAFDLPISWTVLRHAHFRSRMA